jgi:hypothetical protein
MDISINQRLKKVIELKKIEPPEFYKKLGVNRTVWSGWINANKSISVAKIVLILTELKDIDARWLLTGEGEMIYEVNDKVEDGAMEYKITRIDCKECLSKQNEITSLTKALDAKDELLDMYRKKERECG